MGFTLLLPTAATLADAVILVALPSELNGVRKEVRLVGQSVELAGHKVSIGYRKGEKVYIVKTGAGIVNAAMVTEGLIAKYKVDRVISIGVAGNLSGERMKDEGGGMKTEDRSQKMEADSREPNAESQKVGDIFIATDVVSHQQGKETPAGFETKEQQPSAISHRLSAEYKQKCEELRSNAVEVVEEEILRQAQNDKAGEGKPKASVRTGRLVSGDTFIASSDKRKWLRKTFKADAVDMVSAGIAPVCEANGVPYVIIRVLSDNADESASADFATFIKGFEKPITAEIAIRLVEQTAPR